MSLGKILCFFLAFFLAFSVFSQRLPNADFLTDDQLMQFWERAKAKGKSIEQLRAQAIEDGTSPEKVDKLIRRLKTLEESGEVSPLPEPKGTQREFSPEGGTELFLDGSEEVQESNPLEEKLYGYKLFYNKEINFLPNYNMPTPKNYVLGPGDNLEVDIYGTSQASYILTVYPDGSVKLPNIGLVRLTGLTMEEATSKLKQRLSGIYSELRGKNPTVFMSVALSNIRSILITTIGEVQKPGTYVLPSFSNLFNAIYAAGGPSLTGSFREIELWRDGRLKAKMDLYKVLNSGDLSSLPLLKDSDIIRVPPYFRRVEVEGAVRIPGIFELKDSENLQKLLDLAGGIVDGAGRILLVRDRGEDQFVRDLNTNSTDILMDGDIVTVFFAHDNLVSRVQVDGAVTNPGLFGWNEGLTLTELIEQAGGLKPEAFEKKATLFRRDENNLSYVVSLNLEKILGGGQTFKMLPEDFLFIPNRQEIEPNGTIQVSGAINYPSLFPFFKGITLMDALVLSGGLKSSSLNGRIELASMSRDSSKDYEITTISIEQGLESLLNDDIELKRGDHIFVRESADVTREKPVHISGEVNFPGYYLASGDVFTLGELLNRAGGLTSRAYPDGAHLYRLLNTDYASNPNLELRTVIRLRESFKDENNPIIGTLSAYEEKVLEQRLDRLQAQYEAEFKKDNYVLNDSLLVASIDSVIFDGGYEYYLVPVVDLKNSGINENMVLQPNDRVVIPSSNTSVFVEGEVLSPSSLNYEKSLSAKQYVNLAGGFGVNARKGKTYVKYQNGSAAIVRNFIFFRKWPKIMPGATVVVPDGKVKFQFQSTFNNLIALTTSTITTYLLILQLRDRN